MIAIVTVLAAFPLGFLMRSRLTAGVVYSVAYLWAFTFQTLYLLLDALDGTSAPAFEPGRFPVAYGGVALVVLGVGLGLLTAGHRLGGRRRRRAASVPAAV